MSHALKRSKAGRAFTDLGFTFEPGLNERHPETKEIQSASVYFASKDIVKRTKRLNINKRYKYDEEGNMISTKRRNSNGTKNEKYGTNNAESGTVNDIFSTMTDGANFDESTLDEVESSNCDR